MKQWKQNGMENKAIEWNTYCAKWIKIYIRINEGEVQKMQGKDNLRQVPKDQIFKGKPTTVMQ